MTQRSFEGRTVLVVGGTSGIGLATARAFGREGAHVAVAARGAEAGERARQALEGEGTEAAFFVADVREEASIARAVAAAMERFGRLDAAVNSAGAGGDMMPIERADHPIGRMATVDEIARTAVWLCSPGAAYVTAAAIAVDGGFLAA